MEKIERLPEVDEFFAFADACKVTMYAACKRTGTNPSTPDRWKHGRGNPSMAKLKKLRDAVVAIAKEKGTLPEGVEHIEVKQ